VLIMVSLLYYLVRPLRQRPQDREAKVICSPKS